MRVLLTGHHGYIGSVLAPMLLDEGYEVVGFDNDFFAECIFTEPRYNVPAIKKDLRDVEHADLEGFDAVLHLAGLSNDPLGNLNPDLTFEINHAATVRLARIAKEMGVSRFIFSSSCSNYGAAGETFVNEEAALNPVTPYGESKVLVERDVFPMGDGNFCPIFLRNATAYGVSPRLRADLVVNNLVAWAYTTGRVLLKSDGTAWRPLIHVEDIARAFLAALAAPWDKVHGQAFNVGRPEQNYQIRQVAEIVAEVVPNCTLEFAPGASADKRSYQVDTRKIFEVIPDFKPVWDVRMGAEELLDSYMKFELSKDDLEGIRFNRINQLNHLMKLGGVDNDLRWVFVQQA